MYSSIPEPKHLIFFPGAGHEDFLVRDPRRYIKGVNRFLRKYAPLLPVTQESTASPLSLAQKIVENSESRSESE
jgi:hypothetical protein